MTFDECKKSLKNVMHDEDGYEEYSEHHLKTVWDAAIRASAKIANGTLDHLASPLAPYNHGVLDAKQAIAKAIRAL